jgi:hypothetical protein
MEMFQVRGFSFTVVTTIDCHLGDYF